jgi:hypothetical protein
MGSDGAFALLTAARRPDLYRVDLARIPHIHALHGLDHTPTRIRLYATLCDTVTEPPHPTAPHT